MADKREAILSRIHEILLGVPGFTAARNRGDFEAIKRPALIVLDADENEELKPASSRPGATSLMTLRPEVHIALDPRGTHKDSVGQDLSEIRALLLKALLLDAQLITIVGTSGQIRYEGCLTDQAEGRTLAGKMHLMIAFTYAFRINDL